MEPTSPAPALEDDDLLAEFLLRLPPQPSTLPRVGLVCKRWRRLVTDPRFVRRFRAFHRRTPPLHGLITRGGFFFPTQEPPDRLPPSRFCRDRWCGEAHAQFRWVVHCCRHGLVLCCRAEGFASEFLVVDPMAGDDDRSRRRRIQHEGAFLIASTMVSVASGGAAADRRSFLLVALFADAIETRRLTASVYSSDSGAWASSVSAVLLPSPAIPMHHPSSLVGNAIYWFLSDGGEIVRFDLGTRSLSIIEYRPRPPEPQGPWTDFRCWILPPVSGAAAAGDDAGDGRFCLALMSGLSIEFWERDAAARWVLCKTVELDKLLPVQFEEEYVYMQTGISGFDEESNVIFVWTTDGVFRSYIEFESTMQFEKVLETRINVCYLFPYSSV